MLPLLSLLPAVLPIASQLLGGLFGGGQQQSGEGDAQAAASSDQLAQLAPLLAQVGERRGESAGALAAALPALVAQRNEGAGAGGLAAQLGASTAGAFLASQLARAAQQTDPQAQAGLAELGRRAAMAGITDHQTQTARALAAAVRAALGPQLDEVKRLAQERANQTQATAEHREILARDEFRREIRARLAAIESQLQPRGAARRF